MAKAKNNPLDGEIVLNFPLNVQAYLVPGAILISGIMVTVTLFLL